MKISNLGNAMLKKPATSKQYNKREGGKKTLNTVILIGTNKLLQKRMEYI